MIVMTSLGVNAAAFIIQIMLLFTVYIHVFTLFDVVQRLIC